MTFGTGWLCTIYMTEYTNEWLHLMRHVNLGLYRLQFGRDE